MTGIEFKPWPKIPRLNREIIVTEKIDGTNAAIGVIHISNIDHIGRPEQVDSPYQLFDTDAKSGLIVGDYVVYAQSRKLLINPDKDNAGFARWVWENAAQLVKTLGEGLHYGEWWGSGINRGYGLLNGDKRFSLFNTPRYGDPTKFDLEPLKEIGVDTVPVLYQGMFSQERIEMALLSLRINGSVASPLFMNPEGIIIFHTAAQTPFKVTIVDDEKPKGSNE